jgi:plastocyanin
MRGTFAVRCSALMLVVCARALCAQGAVSGQINLLERAGEQSEDLADAIVWLEPTGATRARTTQITTTIQLEKRQFSPRVRAVTEGSKVEFPNMDSFSHNVFSKAPDGAFDTGVYPRGRTKDQTFKEAGIFPIYCNIHPRMTGYVMVLKTPFFAQAGQDGRFSVTGVPAGTYVLHAWHDRAAQEKTQTVAVTASGMTVGRVELDARGFRFVQHKNKFGQEYTNASGDRY